MKQYTFLKFASLQEAVVFSNTMEIEKVSQLHVISAAALLLASKETGNVQLMNACLDRLMSDSQTASAIKYMLNRMYGRYGVDELMYLYQEYSYDDFYRMMEERCRTIWETELKWDVVAKQLELKQLAAFVHHFLSLRLTGAFTRIIHELAQDRFPGLTYAALRNYVMVRKGTKYQFSFSTCDNAEGLRLCEEFHITGMSENKFNTYRKQFGYAPEPPAVILQETPEWKKEHRNEILFCKRTGANTIEEDAQNQVLDYVQKTMGYADETVADLRNWLMIARYEGRSAEDIPVSNATKDRYEGGNQNTPFIKKMRIDILQCCNFTALGDVFVNTLLANIGGMARRNILMR